MGGSRWGAAPQHQPGERHWQQTRPTAYIGYPLWRLLLPTPTHADPRITLAPLCGGFRCEQWKPPQSAVSVKQQDRSIAFDRPTDRLFADKLRVEFDRCLLTSYYRSAPFAVLRARISVYWRRRLLGEILRAGPYISRGAERAALVPAHPGAGRGLSCGRLPGKSAPRDGGARRTRPKPASSKRREEVLRDEVLRSLWFWRCAGKLDSAVALVFKSHRRYSLSAASPSASSSSGSAYDNHPCVKQ